MRGAVWGALCLLALTACGGAPAASSLPETAPAGTLSAPAAVTEGRTPEEAYALPAEMESLKTWLGRSAWNRDPVGRLAELPAQEAALFGVTKWQDSAALLQWGDSLAEFVWGFGGPLIAEPVLQCWDVDQDGQEELVLVNHVGSGTGVSVEELHVIEKNADGTLTDHRFPESLWREQLSQLLSTAVAEGRTFAVLGTELVEITGELGEDLDPAVIEGLHTGSIARFRIEAFQGEPGGAIRFGGSACLDAEGYYNWYVADISADVSYQDGRFSLSGMHLDSFAS